MSMIKYGKTQEVKHERYKYVTIEEYKCAYKDKTITVPINFLTDGFTGGFDYGHAWVVHDYLYATHTFDDNSECTREQADEIMTNIMHEEHMGWREKLFRFVTKHNLFWIFSKAWELSFARGPEFM